MPLKMAIIHNIILSCRGIQGQHLRRGDIVIAKNYSSNVIIYRIFLKKILRIVVAIGCYDGY